MAEAFLLSAIQTLESWVVNETYHTRLINDRVPYREEMDGLINELRMIVDFLRDKKLREESRLYYLIGDLIEIVRDAVTLEEDYGLEEYARGSGGSRNSSPWVQNLAPVDATVCGGHTSFGRGGSPVGAAAHFYQKIKSVRSWVGEAKMHMLQVGADGAEAENFGEGEDEDVEEDVKLLLQKAIFHGKRQFRTLSITGMAGIGKTTLVRKVYNHGDVVDRFELRAWVCVSSVFSHTEVLMKLIQQVVDGDQLQRMEKMERADNASLQEMLRQHLEGMRYFIVLDDLQKEMRLESILKALPEDKGSRLLLISRSQKIDIFVDYNHQMKPLDSGKSWKLFVQTIFRGTSEHKLSKQLEKKGREMLRKCGGLPLAIKEVGRQLAEKRKSGSEWEQLLDEPINLDSTLELLEPTYHRLDPDLKSCFLHLAFFKENATMRAEKLTQIWAAAGMQEPGSSLSYLVNGLIRESIIEAEDKSCRINVVLHRLSIKKAEEEIGFEILSISGNINRPSLSPRHRVIICSRDKFNYSASQDKHLISLIFHGGGYFDASPSYWKSFEQLRILDLEDFGLKILPDSIGTLTELRYLGLRNNHIQELPQSLGCLYNLEVLDIALNFMVEVPDIIWQMSSLLHLYMSDVISRNPLKIGALQNLQTLTYVSVDNWTYELSGLKIMTRLRKLGIREVDENSDVSKLFASLAKLKDFDHLILRGCRFRSMPCLNELGILRRVRALKLDGCLAMLPSADNFPPYLKYLTLVNSCLDEDPMPVLKKLPDLEHLKLRNAYTGQQMVISRQGFHQLQVLCIEELWKLRNLQVGEGAMECLRKIEIRNCPYLETLPKKIASRTRLKEFNMVTTKNIASKIQKLGLISKIRDVDINP